MEKCEIPRETLDRVIAVLEDHEISDCDGESYNNNDVIECVEVLKKIQYMEDFHQRRKSWEDRLEDIYVEMMEEKCSCQLSTHWLGPDRLVKAFKDTIEEMKSFKESCPKHQRNMRGE